MSQTDTARRAASPLSSQSPIIVVRIDCIEAFIEQMVYDAAHIRHREVCCSSLPSTTGGHEPFTFARVIAGYILEDDDGPRLVELRYPCGRLGGSGNDEAKAAYVLSVQAAASIKAAVLDTGLRWRVGRLTLDPSPLMPQSTDLLRSLCNRTATPAGTTYSPWTDGAAVGLECRRHDGHRTFLYLNPSGEDDEGHGSVFIYHGTAGDPAKDTPQHWYDPFPATTLDCYTVRTVNNGERQWQAESPMHAREQHVDAFGGQPGEEILAVLYGNPASPESVAESSPGQASS